MDVYKTLDIGELLRNNSYPGRGIVVGKSSSAAVIAYFIMGRSENSRNRIFSAEGDAVTIYPYDESKVSDPSLIIYSPLRVCGNSHIVTNGDQTDTVYDFVSKGGSFEAALDTRCFEPDAPNYTPRISGIVELDGGFTYKLNILKSADAEGSACNRYTFAYSPLDGVGHFLHTYNGDGNPIPSFTGEPERVAIPETIDEMTSLLWDNLNEQNKVSLLVRYIDLASGKFETRVVNKWTK